MTTVNKTDDMLKKYNKLYTGTTTVSDTDKFLVQLYLDVKVKALKP